MLTFDIFAKVPEIDFLSVGHLHEKGEEQGLCRVLQMGWQRKLPIKEPGRSGGVYMRFASSV